MLKLSDLKKTRDGLFFAQFGLKWEAHNSHLTLVQIHQTLRGSLMLFIDDATPSL